MDRVFASLREYLHGKLTETVNRVGLDADPVSEDFLYCLQHAMFARDTPRDALTDEPSYDKPLLWGDFDATTALRHDCERAKLAYFELAGIPVQVCEEFAKALRAWPKIHVGALLDTVIDAVQSLALAWAGPWQGLTLLPCLNVTAEATARLPAGEWVWPISGTLSFVDHPFAGYPPTLRTKVAPSLEVNPGKDSKARADLETCLQLLRVQFVAHCTPYLWIASDGPLPFADDFGDNQYEGRRGSWLADRGVRAEIDGAGLIELQRRWPNWAQRDYPAVNAAVEHFEDAIFSPELTSAVAAAVQSLSSLLVRDKQRYERNQKVDETDKRSYERRVLCRRAPTLIDDTFSSEWKWWNRILDDLYEVARNPKVHGVTQQVRTANLIVLAKREKMTDTDLALTILRGASTAILRVHDRLASGETMKDLLASLD